MISGMLVKVFLIALLFLVVGFSIIFWVNRKERNQLDDMLSEIPLGNGGHKEKKLYVNSPDYQEFLRVHSCG